MQIELSCLHLGILMDALKCYGIHVVKEKFLSDEVSLRGSLNLAIDYSYLFLQIMNNWQLALKEESKNENQCN